MKREALADRIVNYSDALVAFAGVNALAYVVTMGEPDVRCSMRPVAGWLIGLNLFIAVAVCAAILGLRRLELRLRPLESLDPVVAAFWRWASLVRVLLVCLVVGFVIVGLVGTRFEASCGPLPG